MLFAKDNSPSEIGASSSRRIGPRPDVENEARSIEVGCREPKTHFTGYERALFRCRRDHVLQSRSRPPNRRQQGAHGWLMAPARPRPFARMGAPCPAEQFRRAPSYYLITR